MKYFFHNKKRTYRAILILSINLIILVSLNLLIGAYINEIENFRSQLQTGETKLIISPVSENDNNLLTFSSQVYNQITEIIDDTPEVSHYIPTFSILTKSNISELENVFLNTEIVDINLLKSHNEIILLENEYYGNFFLSDSLDGLNLNFSDSIAFNFIDTTMILNFFGMFSDSTLRNVDVLIDANSLDLSSMGGVKWNRIYVTLSDAQNYNKVINKFQKINGIEIESSRGDTIFLTVSASQLIQLLQLLQISLFVLITFAITNILISLVIETREDIKIMKSLGFHQRDINFIYIGQSLIVGFISSIISLGFSIVILSALISIITALTFLPYTTISINVNFLIVNSMFSIATCLVSGIFAIKRI